MQSSLSLAVASSVVAAVTFASEFAVAQETTTIKTIAVSGDVATGLFIGFFLIGMLLFAVMMMMDISTSDMLGTKREEQNQPNSH